MDGDTIGIVAHGHGTIIDRNDDGVEVLEPVWREIYGSSPFDWAEGVVFMRACEGRNRPVATGNSRVPAS
jgi:hypothetical protein